MRSLLLVACMVAVAASAAAQNPEPRPFVTAEVSATLTTIDGGSPTRTVGFDALAGGPSLPGVQLFGTFGRGAGVGRTNPGWYGTAGVRRVLPSVWRFRPYVDASAGLARMAPDVINRSTVPMIGGGAGAQLLIGKHFTIDAGYRAQAFLGDVDCTRARPYLGFGVNF